MTETLQASVNLARVGAVCIKPTVLHVAPGLALFADMKVFHGDQFGDRETIMHFGQPDLFPRICNAGFIISPRSGNPRCMKIATVPARTLQPPIRLKPQATAL